MPSTSKIQDQGSENALKQEGGTRNAQITAHTAIEETTDADFTNAEVGSLNTLKAILRPEDCVESTASIRALRRSNRITAYCGLVRRLHESSLIPKRRLSRVRPCSDCGRGDLDVRRQLRLEARRQFGKLPAVAEFEESYLRAHGQAATQSVKGCSKFRIITGMTLRAGNAWTQATSENGENEHDDV